MASAKNERPARGTVVDRRVAVLYAGLGLLLLWALAGPTLYLDPTGSPADWMRSLVATEGGLPVVRQAVGLRYVDEQIALGFPCAERYDPVANESCTVLPVESWRLEGEEFVQRGNSYTVNADFRVRYAGGQEALLRWEASRLGFAGPKLAVGLGRLGTPGTLWRLELPSSDQGPDGSLVGVPLQRGGYGWWTWP